MARMPLLHNNFLAVYNVNALGKLAERLACLAHKHAASGVDIALEQAALGLNAGDAGADEVGIAYLYEVDVAASRRGHEHINELGAEVERHGPLV